MALIALNKNNQNKTRDMFNKKKKNMVKDIESLTIFKKHLNITKTNKKRWKCTRFQEQRLSYNIKY